MYWSNCPKYPSRWIKNRKPFMEFLLFRKLWAWLHTNYGLVIGSVHGLTLVPEYWCILCEDYWNLFGLAKFTLQSLPVLELWRTADFDSRGLIPWGAPKIKPSACYIILESPIIQAYRQPRGIPKIPLAPSTGKALQCEPSLAPKHGWRKFSLSNKITYPHSTKKPTVTTQEIATAAKEVASKATDTVHLIIT